MITTFFTYIVLSVICLFPIVIWGYIFSYIDNDSINKQRFSMWILWWALSVFPILYMDKLLSIFRLDYLNIFYFVHKITWFFSALQFQFSLSLFLFFLVICSFLFWLIFVKNKKLLMIYIKNLVVFLVLVFFISFIIYLLNFLLNSSFFHDIKVEQIKFMNIVFDSFKLIVFYYFIVSFIEETSKHFNFLQTSVLYIDSVKTGVLYSIFVALWFSLIENILYLYNSYIQFGISNDFLKTYFYRSFFSVMVHILCSSFIAYYFSKAFIIYKNNGLNFPYFKVFMIWLFFWIIFHLIFDISLSTWFLSIIFIYFLFWYFYVSSIFYRE